MIDNIGNNYSVLSEKSQDIDKNTEKTLLPLNEIKQVTNSLLSPAKSDIHLPHQQKLIETRTVTLDCLLSDSKYNTLQSYIESYFHHSGSASCEVSEPDYHPENGTTRIGMISSCSGFRAVTTQETQQDRWKITMGLLELLTRAELSGELYGIPMESVVSIYPEYHPTDGTVRLCLESHLYNCRRHEKNLEDNERRSFDSVNILSGYALYAEQRMKTAKEWRTELDNAHRDAKKTQEINASKQKSLLYVFGVTLLQIWDIDINREVTKTNKPLTDDQKAIIPLLVQSMEVKLKNRPTISQLSALFAQIRAKSDDPSTRL